MLVEGKNEAFLDLLWLDISYQRPGLSRLVFVLFARVDSDGSTQCYFATAALSLVHYRLASAEEEENLNRDCD